MQEKIRLLSRLPLFRGVPESERDRQIENMRGVCRTVSKGTVLLREGEPTSLWGILLSGELQGQRVEEDGTLSVLKRLGKGDLFGEILVFSETPSPITLKAMSDSEVLLLQKPDFAETDPTLTRNLLKLIGEEYWALHQKIRYCGIRSLRNRILSYLKDRESRPGEYFTVPFDRNDLAAYLNADRSALSRELSRMKKDGLIEYKKNCFQIKNLSSGNAETHCKKSMN